MNLIAILFSTLILAAQRLWNQRLLIICLLVGLVAAVGLLSSIPLYADTAYRVVLQKELNDPNAASGIRVGTRWPSFAFLWRYVGAWQGDIDWDAYAPVDEYLAQQAPSIIGLPLKSLVRHVKTGNLRLFTAADSETFTQREPLLYTQLGFITGLEAHIELVEGAFPSLPEGEEVQVIVSRELAEQLGLQVGERYVLLGKDASARLTGGQAQIGMQIAGIWQPLNPTDPFWLYPPQSFSETLLTSEAAFRQQVAPVLIAPISQAVWYQVFDGDRVRTADVPGLLARVAKAQSRAAALLPHANLDVSPIVALKSYQETARLLTVVLTIFSIPLVGLLLYFIVLIAGLVVRGDQSEIAILRSRGTTRGQVLLVYLLEGLLVGSLGLAGGLILGGKLAGLMGRTRTFLAPSLVETGVRQGSEFTNVVFSPAALWYGVLGVGLAILALLLPALAASRRTIVTFRWERARVLIRPLYQRYYLDLLLLALALYGWYLLRKQGTIVVSGMGADPFSNPLLFLAPALFCFSMSLLFVRAFPWLMSALAWCANWLPSTTLLLTLRQLARSAGQYTGPLLLLSLTLSLAAFSASMAVTLDRHLEDQIYYQVGADLNLTELGESTPDFQQSGLPITPALPSSPAEEGARWLFLPVSEHLRAPGVRAAARVGDYSATSSIGGQQQKGRLLGVDRLDFPAVAFYRADFAAGESLGGLMNRLAADPASLLVSRGYLAQHGLSVGDPLRLRVSTAGVFHEIAFTVAAPLDFFPTLYPQDGPFFIANLDYVHQALGGAFPYNVWLATDPDVPAEEVVAELRALRLNAAAAADARSIIAEAQNRPERQGLFGLLTAGFLASALLTVLGFLVYAIVSFQRRFIELGALRALGLSVSQMAGYLVGEQLILILTGAGLGTILGIKASQLFIPYLQTGEGRTARIPPFVVQIAWDELWLIYAVFGGMFLVAVAVLIVSLLRMKIFEAVKMGEVG